MVDDERRVPSPLWCVVVMPYTGVGLLVVVRDVPIAYVMSTLDLWVKLSEYELVHLGKSLLFLLMG